MGLVHMRGFQEMRTFFLRGQQESSLKTKWVATLLGKRLPRETVTLGVLSGTLGSLDAYCSGPPDVPPQGETTMGGGMGSGHHVPPLEGEGLPAHVGAAVHLPVQHVVRGEVVDEGAVEAQRLQQGPHLLLQAALAVDDGPEGLGDAQVLPQH